MTDSTEQNQKEELRLLKQRADQIGVAYSPNIGLDTLRQRVDDKLAGKVTAPEEDVAPPKEGQTETKIQRRNRLRREAEKLIRVRLTCMNPAKRDYQGELITVGNSILGTYRKYIPFGVDWHVPQIMLNMLKERKYQVFRKEKARGVEHKVAEFVPEFAIQELPPLTPEELKSLAQRQRMADGTAEQ